MPDKLKILVVEDRIEDAELIAHELRRAGLPAETLRVETEEEYLSALDISYDVILADYTLPQFSGLRALELLNQKGLNIPFLIVTGSIGEELAVDAMKKGAADYLLKDRMGRLGTAITQALEKKNLQSDKEHLQDQLLQVQKMEAIGRLAGGIAHDFNNLLTTILGSVEIAREEISPAHPLQFHLNNVERAANRSSELVRQLLTFARKQPLQEQFFDVHEVLMETRDLMGPLLGAAISLTLQISERPEPVYADSGHIQQALINLIINARDALPKGGNIWIKTTKMEIAETGSTLLPLPPGPYLSIIVSDDGAGIPEEIRARIFEPFFTTKELGKGTGLGLATSYGIVKQCGGHIHVESEPGKGTVFTIYLPQGRKAVCEEGPKSQ